MIAQYTVRLGDSGEPLQAWLFLRYADGWLRRRDAGAGHAMRCGCATASPARSTCWCWCRPRPPRALADMRERVAALKGVDDVTTVPVLRTTLDRR